ncbi:hypothetical protein ACIQNU_02435 [Streptomyces sp. NPDC091292]|uniref:hypothetical protein n=1 Tax=Streptomyces sp. NPDC091292 TaxID=3365991 RepID=UPI003805730A
MTGPTSAPRGERAGTPGAHWEHVLVTTEVVVDTDTDGESPFGWQELPVPNRATRRAIARAARRTK